MKLRKWCKNCIWFALLAVLVWAVVGCGSTEDEADGKTYDVYYIDKDITKTVATEYRTDTQDASALLEELLDVLSEQPEDEDLLPALPAGLMMSYSFDGGQLSVDFDSKYRDLDNIREILARAALVRTLTQVPDLTYVSFTVQGEALTDSTGAVIGMMTADQFIDNAGAEINTYEKVNLYLYFANEDGTGLVQETQRNVLYSSNIALEKLVVEKLIEGPTTETAYPTINPATKIVNVTVKDGICYVNLDEGFLNQIYNVSPEVTIYSITNSLVELSNINKVQISINGDSEVNYRESISLTSIFERNLNILAPDEEETEDELQDE